jgi:WD40 repeat protein
VIASLKGNSDVEDVAFSPDGQRVVTAADGGTARVWNVDAEEVLATPKDGAWDLYAAVFSPNGQQVATAAADGSAWVWNAVSGQVIANLKGHTGSVESIAFSPNGQLVLTASRDKTARRVEYHHGARARDAGRPF